jgi:hypothetical protein
VPDKEKYEVFLRAQKTVAEQNTTKGVPAPSARPTGVLRNPNRAVSSYRLLSAGLAVYIFIYHYNILILHWNPSLRLKSIYQNMILLFLI